jgi:hypothetical protein
MGLTFAINQDQSNCFNCQATGFWNQNVCACSCINNQKTTGCQCTSPKIWKDYPVCGCGCPSIIIRPPIFTSGAVNLQASSLSLPSAASDTATTAVTTATPSAATDSLIFRGCLAPRYYSQNTCTCVCNYRYCPPKYYFDETVCDCMAILY